jgi:hypothetical protein
LRGGYGDPPRETAAFKARLLHFEPDLLRVCDLERPGVDFDLDAILALEPFRYSPRVPA